MQEYIKMTVCRHPHTGGNPDTIDMIVCWMTGGWGCVKKRGKPAFLSRINFTTGWQRLVRLSDIARIGIESGHGNKPCIFFNYLTM